MTYGWALLIVLVAIGALAFFGVLNPSKFLPQQCMLGPGLACDDYKVSSSEQRIHILVRNGMGKDFDLFLIYPAKQDVANGKEVCGGVAGYVTIPGLQALQPIFKDGEARKIYSLNANGNSGIYCGDRQQNCCSVLNNPIVCGSAGADCACETQYSCFPSSSFIPQAGGKFNNDMVIVYKEKGSKIIHARVGRLTTQIE